MKRRAFTMLELLCVVAIIAALAAIVFPATLSAIQRSKISKGVAQLRQLHVAFKIYQADYDGDGRYGSASQMGLPDLVHLYSGSTRFVAEEERLWFSPCGKHVDTPTGSTSFTYYASNLPDEPWAAHSSKMQDESILLVDRNCNGPEVVMSADGFQKRLISIRLSGQVKIVNKRGDATSISIWE